MTSDVVIELEGVWRRYRISSAKRPRVLRATITQDPLRRHTDRWLWALRGVDLDVHRGEAVGLIGRNGAGKSTLLRLIGDVGRPDRGTLRVHGRSGALVDLGNELHGDLTGRQNVEISGVIAGLSRREVRERFDEIIEFAELVDFVDEPLRAYSDGMRARLAFSVVAHLSPDILLVDEALAVGDAAFQRRALDRIGQLRDDGVAIILVSHDMTLVRRVCDRALWLDHGEVVARGRPKDVVEDYLRASGATAPLPDLLAAGCIMSVRLLDEWGSPAVSVSTGDGLIVEVETAPPPAEGWPLLQVRLVRSETENLLVDTSMPIAPGEARIVRLTFDRLDLAPGDHRIEVALHAAGWATRLDIADPIPLEVRGPVPKRALMDPPHHWSRGSSGARGRPNGIAAPSSSAPNEAC